MYRDRDENEHNGRPWTMPARHGICVMCSTVVETMTNIPIRFCPECKDETMTEHCPHCKEELPYPLRGIYCISCGGQYTIFDRDPSKLPYEPSAEEREDLRLQAPGEDLHWTEILKRLTHEIPKAPSKHSMLREVLRFSVAGNPVPLEIDRHTGRIIPNELRDYEEHE